MDCKDLQEASKGVLLVFIGGAHDLDQPWPRCPHFISSLDNSSADRFDESLMSHQFGDQRVGSIKRFYQRWPY